MVPPVLDLKEFHFLKFLIKYAPIVSDFFMEIYLALLFFGIGYHPYSVIIYYLVGYSLFGAFILFHASRLFKFCGLHRSFIYHNSVTNICIYYQLTFGFGSSLFFFRFFIFFVGLLLFALLFLRLYHRAF